MIRNIILDLGGVVLDIDYHRTIREFESLGIKNASELYSQKAQSKLFDQLEKAEISEADFYDQMRRLCAIDISDEEIKNAWNALLIGLREENVNALKKLKSGHRLFLLSNTNSIHESAYRKMIIDKFGHFVFDELFEKMYLSHHLGMRKPDAAIFERVIEENGLNKSETLFVDDSPQHVEGAIKVGLHALHFKPGMKLELITAEVAQRIS